MKYQSEEGEALAGQVALGDVAVRGKELLQLGLLDLVRQVAHEQSAAARELLLGQVGQQLALGEGAACEAGHGALSVHRQIGRRIIGVGRVLGVRHEGHGSGQAAHSALHLLLLLHSAALSAVPPYIRVSRMAAVLP